MLAFTTLLLSLASLSPLTGVTASSTVRAATPARTIGVEDIGTLGAKLDLGRGWRRGELIPDLGPDQFTYGRGANSIGLAVSELQGLFVDEADFRSSIDATRDGLLEGLGDRAKAGKTTVETRGDLVHAITSARGKANGFEVEFQIHVVGTAGLAYQFMIWSGASRTDAIEKRRVAVVEGLEFPGAASAWRRGLKLRRFKRRIGSTQLTFRAPPSILHDSTDTHGGVLTVSSHDQRFLILFDELPGFGDPGSVLDANEEDFAETWKEAKTLRRAPCTIGGVDGRMSAVLATDGGEGVYIESYVVRVDDDTFLEVRVASNGADGAHRALRDELLASITLTAAPKVDAFPEPDPDAAVEDDALRNPDVFALLEGSTLHGSLKGYVTSAELVPGGLILGVGTEIVRVLPMKPGTETLYSGYEPSWGTLSSSVGTATSRGRTHVIEDDTLVRIVDGTREELGVHADAVTALDDGRLVLIRTSPLDVPLGFVVGYGQSSELAVRSVSGREKALDWDSLDNASGMTGSGSHLLVRAATEDYYDNNEELWILDVDRPESPIELGVWRNVIRATESEDGWLVSGQPPVGPPGAWLIRHDGSRSLLISGLSPTALSVLDGRLFVVETRIGNGNQVSEIRSIALERALSIGPKILPWAVSDLATIAGDAFENVDDDLANLDRLTAMLERADALSVETHGKALPVHATAVDELIEACAGSVVLGDDGRALLAALVVRSLLEHDATWIASPDEGRTGIHPSQATLSNDLAIAVHATSSVLLSGNFESSVYAPVKTSIDGADGRKIFVGTDVGALRAAIATESAQLDGIDFASARLTDLEELCDAHPRNVELRRTLYGGLARSGRTRIAGALAKRFVARPDASAADLAASLGDRLIANDAPADLVRDLRLAIAGFPGELVLYVMLGQAYERRSQADDDARARACYDHALSRYPAVNVRTAAEEGLARLEGR